MDETDEHFKRLRSHTEHVEGEAAALGAQGWGEASKGTRVVSYILSPQVPLPSPVTNGTSSAQVRGWEQTGWARDLGALLGTPPETSVLVSWICEH